MARARPRGIVQHHPAAPASELKISDEAEHRLAREMSPSPGILRRHGFPSKTPVIFIVR